MQRRLFLNRVGASAAVIGTGTWAGPIWAAEEAISAKHLNIGCSIAMSGPLGSAGNEHIGGVRAAFATVNRNGGLFGRELRLITRDDKYDPKLSAANVKQMLDGNEALAFISQIGTPNTAAVIPLIEKAGAPLVGPITGAASLRRPDLANVFHIRPSYTDEVTRMIEQISAMGLQNIAFVYLNNPFGKEVLKDAQRAMDERKIKASAELPLEFNGSNASDVSQKVMDAKAGAVFVAATGTGVTDFVASMRERAPALPIIGLSVSFTDLARLGQAKAAGLALAQVFPSTKAQKFVTVRTYQAALAAFNNFKAPIGGALESWINAQVMIEGLRRAGRDVTRDKLRQGLASIRNMEIGEMRLGFSASAPWVGSLPVRIGVIGPDLLVRV